MTLDLPPRLATDWISWALVVASGLVVEAVAAQHPAMPVGVGIAMLAGLSVWHWARTRPGRVLRTASLEDSGCWRLQFQDGRCTHARLARGTRLLGRSVVLRWNAGHVGCAIWLTPWDLPDPELRRLTVRLRALGDLDRVPQQRFPHDP